MHANPTVKLIEQVWATSFIKSGSALSTVCINKSTLVKVYQNVFSRV